MKKTNYLLWGGVGLLAVGVAAYVAGAGRQDPMAQPNPAPGGGGFLPDIDVPIAPLPYGPPVTALPPGATTPASGGNTTVLPAPDPNAGAGGAYVPGRDRPGGSNIDTNAPCSSGGQDSDTLYNMADMVRGQKAWAGTNPDALKRNLQQLSNTVFQYGLDACLALSTFPDGDARLSDDCRARAQLTAQAATSIRAEFSDLPCPDAFIIQNWTSSALYANNPAARACIDAAVARCGSAAVAAAAIAKPLGIRQSVIDWRSMGLSADDIIVGL